MVVVLYLVTNDTLLQKTKVYYKMRKRLYYKMRRLLQMRQYIHLKYLRSRSRLTFNLRYMQIWNMFNWFCSFSGWWVLRYFSRGLEVWLKLCSFSSREKCPNTEFFFSGLYFPAFGLNTERYGVSLRIQSKCGKIFIHYSFILYLL